MPDGLLSFTHLHLPDMSLLDSAFNGNDPEAGKKVSASWLRRLWSMTYSNRIKSIVGGTLKQSTDGVDIVIAQTSYPGRAYAAYGSASTSVTTGATCSLTALVQDHDATTATNMELCTLASNQITFTKPGQYLVTYHASFELDIGGATTHVPAVTTVTSYLRASGNTLAGTTHYASAAQVPNLSGFLKADGADQPEIQVALGGATGKTEAFDVVAYALEGGGPQNGPTDVTFDGDNKQAVTLDTQTLDATDNFGRLADYSTTGAVRTTTSGTTLVKVVLNSSGVLKIRVPGPTDYAPILDIYATGADSRSVTNVSTSLSITRLA